MKSLLNHKSTLIASTIIGIFSLCILSNPPAEAQVPEPYVLRYDLQEENMIIEKIVRGEGRLF